MMKATIFGGRAMVVDISVRKTAGGQYRASATRPFSAVAEGTTQDEAVTRLKDDLEEGLRNGTTTVRIHIGEPVSEPVWPDDEFTAAWLQGIRQARLAANTRPDPWDDEPEAP
jgi:hypothetical protein